MRRSALASAAAAWLLSPLAGSPAAQPFGDGTWRPHRPLVLEGDIVTMGARGVIADGHLLLQDGEVRGVLGSEETFTSIDKLQHLRTDAWLFPGFVNLHTHAHFNHFLSNDADFFQRLALMRFPFIDALEAAYRPFATRQ